jgi:neopullulanase
MKIRTITLSILILLHIHAIAQNTDSLIWKADPPYWWTGMQNPELQILLYGKSIGKFVPTIAYEGLSVTSFHSFENPDYLVIELLFEKDCQPGFIPFTLQNGNAIAQLQYELKQKNDYQPQGISTKDLVYLIMPDRFANGNIQNDHIETFNESGVDRSEPFKRHGGDLQGIIDHLNYIRDMGITALWLNPVEENNGSIESYHGYAISDHYKIDRRLGDFTTYKNLISGLHEKDMKIIKDVVLNHISSDHYLAKSPPAKDWINEWPDFTRSNFRAPVLMDVHASEMDKKVFSDGWFDNHMPDLNLLNPYLARYLIQNSIWWIAAFNIDAFRIDTYAYANQEFMKNWLSAIHEEYPGFFAFAETWVHGKEIQAWFVGETGLNKKFDNGIRSVTDFQLQYALTKTFTETYGWTAGVNALYYTLVSDFLYPHPENNIIFLDNHDLPRIAGLLNGNMEKYKSAITLLLTLRGIPQILYGTEIMMSETENHGLIREDFPGGWPVDTVSVFDKINLSTQTLEAIDFFSKLANWRKTSEAITKGKLIHFIPEDDLYVFFRIYQKEKVMVVINAFDKSQTIDFSNYAEIIKDIRKGELIPSSQKVDLSNEIELKPWQSLIISF